MSRHRRKKVRFRETCNKRNSSCEYYAGRLRRRSRHRNHHERHAGDSKRNYSGYAENSRKPLFHTRSVQRADSKEQLRRTLHKPKVIHPSNANFKNYNSGKLLKERVRRNVIKPSEPNGGRYFTRIKKFKKRNESRMRESLKHMLSRTLEYGLQKGILKKKGSSFKLTKPYRSYIDSAIFGGTHSDILSKYAVKKHRLDKSVPFYPDKSQEQSKCLHKKTETTKKSRKCIQSVRSVNSSLKSSSSSSSTNRSLTTYKPSEHKNPYRKFVKKKPYPPPTAQHNSTPVKKIDIGHYKDDGCIKYPKQKNSWNRILEEYQKYGKSKNKQTNNHKAERMKSVKLNHTDMLHKFHHKRKLSKHRKEHRKRIRSKSKNSFIKRYVKKRQKYHSKSKSNEQQVEKRNRCINYPQEITRKQSKELIHFPEDVHKKDFKNITQSASHTTQTNTQVTEDPEDTKRCISRYRNIRFRCKTSSDSSPQAELANPDLSWCHCQNKSASEELRSETSVSSNTDLKIHSYTKCSTPQVRTNNMNENYFKNFNEHPKNIIKSDSTVTEEPQKNKRCGIKTDSEPQEHPAKWKLSWLPNFSKSVSERSRNSSCDRSKSEVSRNGTPISCFTEVTSDVEKQKRKSRKEKDVHFRRTKTPHYKNRMPRKRTKSPKKKRHKTQNKTLNFSDNMDKKYFKNTNLSKTIKPITRLTGSQNAKQCLARYRRFWSKTSSNSGTQVKPEKPDIHLSPCCSKSRSEKSRNETVTSSCSNSTVNDAEMQTTNDHKKQYIDCRQSRKSAYKSKSSRGKNKKHKSPETTQDSSENTSKSFNQNHINTIKSNTQTEEPQAEKGCISRYRNNKFEAQPSSDSGPQEQSGNLNLSWCPNLSSTESEESRYETPVSSCNNIVNDVKRICNENRKRKKSKSSIKSSCEEIYNKLMKKKRICGQCGQTVKKMIKMYNN